MLPNCKRRILEWLQESPYQFLDILITLGEGPSDVNAPRGEASN